ncbi:MAG: NlpC/P60 family protein [Desulfobacterales bacterium]|nr:NlpC/P60 family protein [Desulfobacterales bacterium]
MAAAGAAVAILLFGTSCSTLPLPLPVGKRPPLPVTDVEKQLRAEIHLWQDVPHRLGGMNRQGIDCSALVMQIYRNVFKIQLPRTTEGQVQTGAPVSRDRLRAGDLVFFHSFFSGNHVGIYLNNGDFAHVSKSRGIIISNIAAPHWSRIYWQARRITPLM